MALLSKQDILRGLEKIDAAAKRNGITIDLSIYGGAALALSFDMRNATRDVDAVVNGSPDFLRTVSRQIAEEERWPEDWINDGVKGFTSGQEKMELMKNFDGSAGGLRIYVPAPEYLFAMKCMAMRPEGIDGSHDISDIALLAKVIGIRNAQDALALVEDFYPSAMIPPKVRFGVEEIMDRIVKLNVPETESPLPAENESPKT